MIWWNYLSLLRNVTSVYHTKVVDQNIRCWTMQSQSNIFKKTWQLHSEGFINNTHSILHHIHSIFSHVENARFWINVSLRIKLVKQCIHSNVCSCSASPCTVKSASKYTNIEALIDSICSIFNFRRVISCLHMRHDYMVLSLILKEKCFTNYCF